jgi:hypothetical protein
MSWQRKDIRIAGRRAELEIDLRFRETAPIQELPELHRVAIHCRTPVHRDEFIPQAEKPELLEAEKQLLEIANRRANGWAVQAMRVVSAGSVEYFFYARSARTLDGVAEELAAAFPGHRIEQESRTDAAWEEYGRQVLKEL